ncbi:MAG: hypothetical protein Q4P25_02370 [Tissierellia bacterium]|nr:hypothetical protein [Tissierellia bacterium]
MNVIFGLIMMILPILLFNLIFIGVGRILQKLMNSQKKDHTKESLDDFFRENIKQYHKRKDQRRQKQDELMEQFFRKSKENTKDIHDRSKVEREKRADTFTYETDGKEDQKIKDRIHKQAWSTPLDSIFQEEDFTSKVLKDEDYDLDNGELSFDTDHLIQGFIYSEILDKPLSLR